MTEVGAEAKDTDETVSEEYSLDDSDEPLHPWEIDGQTSEFHPSEQDNPAETAQNNDETQNDTVDDDTDEDFSWATHPDDPDDGSPAVLAPPETITPEIDQAAPFSAFAASSEALEPEGASKATDDQGTSGGLISFNTPTGDSAAPVELNEVRDTPETSKLDEISVIAAAIQGAKDSVKSSSTTVEETSESDPEIVDDSTAPATEETDTELRDLIRATQADAVQSNSDPVKKQSRWRRKPGTEMTGENIEPKQELKSTRDLLNEAMEESQANRSNRGGGKRLAGFVLVVVLFAVGIAAYLFADKLIEIVPALEPFLGKYIGIIDGLRASTQTGLGGIVDSVKDMITGTA